MMIAIKNNILGHFRDTRKSAIFCCSNEQQYPSLSGTRYEILEPGTVKIMQ